MAMTTGWHAFYSWMSCIVSPCPLFPFPSSVHAPHHPTPVLSLDFTSKCVVRCYEGRFGDASCFSSSTWR